MYLGPMSFGELSLMQRAELALRDKYKQREDVIIKKFTEWANANLGYNRTFEYKEFVFVRDIGDVEGFFTEDNVTLVVNVYDDVKLAAVDGVMLHDRESIYDLPSLAKRVNYVRKKRLKERPWYKKLIASLHW